MPKQGAYAPGVPLPARQLALDLLQTVRIPKSWPCVRTGEKVGQKAATLCCRVLWSTHPQPKHPRERIEPQPQVSDILVRPVAGVLIDTDEPVDQRRWSSAHRQPMNAITRIERRHRVIEPPSQARDVPFQHLVGFHIEIESVGCDLYCHQQALETTTPSYRMVLGIFSLLLVSMSEN